MDDRMNDRMDESLDSVEDELMDLVSRARDTIEDFVIEQPHVALAIAAASGFVLGGGLTPRRLVRLGLAFAGPTLTRVAYTEATRTLREIFEGAPIEEHSPTMQS